MLLEGEVIVPLVGLNPLYFISQWGNVYLMHPHIGELRHVPIEQKNNRSHVSILTMTEVTRSVQPGYATQPYHSVPFSITISVLQLMELYWPAELGIDTTNFETKPVQIVAPGNQLKIAV